MKLSRLALLSLFALTSSPVWADGIVTVYSADGLHDGDNSWYQHQFAAFTKATGIKVQYVEGGSGAIVERLAKERTNPQADVLVTVPPFIQRAAKEQLLAEFQPQDSARIPGVHDRYSPLVNNYLTFIYNSKLLKTAPASWQDLLDSRFRNKLQYSTPGQAGDGTAVMPQAFHSMGSKEAGFDYLGKLQANNVGPSASTGKLTALVNKGELYIANGDLQMNLSQMARNPNVQIFWPADAQGERSALALPYTIGLVQNGPNGENGKKLINFLLDKSAQSSVSALSWGLPVRSDVTPEDANFKAAKAALNGVKSWEPNWDDVAVSLSADIARWHKVTDSE
ncbi:2-aminoethylphosphonate ABC transporter substrate-binding protein [Klebsiella michiganensis]|uniref:2-aminoethylphosphonate ABC transporter substrate-binding protein n=1 Tax=Klebsiella michiganensis TaxID=1134687 RepID=UPI00191204C4|nr:2-aminoethylphosphonate ABC transporter substrate-binding protein [Klebsiella michiganensis]MBK6270690.1 2-aminoethylphosphonate ABC transporter substrate-binding protein [Klebsiella michiganensis]HBM2965810.1 2-aminoethylphosphonate ABC transporter substrate-binding protein [Klebsiella michiganensis]HCA7141714.1 2-aminoethylphosphonate ABC transporter substrate-binding protein [Klebsiella michiganensis]HDS7196038.1 2-aminoethylphosphonate ABC transporter substrate-binding protein [Klebsiell